MPVEGSNGFIFVAMTTQQNKLTLFICARKYFAGLIFVVEGDQRILFHDGNFPIYDTYKMKSTSGICCSYYNNSTRFNAKEFTASVLYFPSLTITF